MRRSHKPSRGSSLFSRDRGDRAETELEMQFFLHRASNVLRHPTRIINRNAREPGLADT